MFLISCQGTHLRKFHTQIHTLSFSQKFCNLTLISCPIIELSGNEEAAARPPSCLPMAPLYLSLSYAYLHGPRLRSLMRMPEIVSLFVSLSLGVSLFFSLSLSDTCTHESPWTLPLKALEVCNCPGNSQVAMSSQQWSQLWMWLWFKSTEGPLKPEKDKGGSESITIWGS